MDITRFAGARAYDPPLHHGCTALRLQGFTASPADFATIPERDRHGRPHAYLENKVADGKLGFKTGDGFRAWSDRDMQERRERLARYLVDARNKAGAA